jgi:hypothetical protein
MSSDERVLWESDDVSCVMVSCCAGAELQVRRSRGRDYDVLIRELYPMKSDLYDRARALAAEYSQVEHPEEQGTPRH